LAQTSTLLEDLTEAQREAVTHVDGPLLIIAAAGSGKTRVITRRVAYLIDQGIPATSILAITFTNKAAGELKERVAKVVNRPIRDFGRLDQYWPTLCTFHSLCLRILRHYASRIGLPANFSIYDSGDQTRVIKEALKLLDMSTTNFPPGNVHAAISNAKNQLQTAQMFAQNATDFYARNVSRIYTKYQKLLEQNNALDFDDLLLRTTLAMRDHPDVLRELQDRFQYILIDEYQDTNHAQYVLAHALALRHRNICVVGDPDQSIYAWRGADIKNIMDFEKDYPDAKIVKLEQNYRSSKTILHIAGALIANNKRRKDKALWTENAQGEKAQLFLCQDEYDEANIVARQLKELQEKHGYAWNQMAIFYRMNSLSRVMEDALRKENLPYVMARGVEFYNRKEIKDVLAYLRVISNPNDEISLTRIVNVPTRGIGDASVKQMQAHAIASGITLFEAMQQAGSVAGLSARALNSTRMFVELVNRWRRAAAKREGEGEKGRGGDEETNGMLSLSSPLLVSPSPSLSTSQGTVQKLMEDVIRRSGLEAYYKKEGGEEQAELSNIDQLITSAAEFDRESAEGNLDDYLSMISLVSDVDHLKGNGGAITMMTLHAAKGLEFPVVAMIGLEEGVLPHARARANLDEMEEERRLCFVGVTRAEERLLLTKAAYRTIRGLRERTMTSPFLAEMPRESLEITDRTGVPSSGSYYSGRSAADNDAERRVGQFRKGQMVRHPIHGIGRIVEITGMGLNRRAEVQFNQAGTRMFVLEAARLEVINS
jgi:DNA helicase II / ATP-dependent DNA helicase PcrA